MKKIFSILLVAFAIIILPTISFAKINLDNNIKRAAENYVEIIGENNVIWKDAKTNFEFPLYDFDGNLTGYLFTIKTNGKDSGYLIVSGGSDPVILESTREGTHPYIDNKNGYQNAIYVGPTMYYVQEENDSYTDIREKKKLLKHELKGMGPLSNGNFPRIVTDDSIQPRTIVSYSSKILDVADMTWYIGCSPTSFGNIVRYWDKTGKPNLVQDTTTDNILIDVLAGDMNTNRSTGATGWNDRVNGMVNFWNFRNYSVSVTRVSPSYTTHSSEINNNRPDIINVIGDPTYSNHDMTGVGYEHYQDSNQGMKWIKYVVVHDTWSSTNKNVYLYLDNFSSWNEIVKVIPN